MKSCVHMKSPVDTALVHPRRKAGQAKLGRGALAIIVSKSDVEQLMHLRLSEASKQLGLSATTLKKVCRTLGIYKWSDTSFSTTRSRSDTSAHKKHESEFNGVTATFFVTDAMHVDHATAPMKLGPSNSGVWTAANQSLPDEWLPSRQLGGWPASSRAASMSCLDEGRAFAQPTHSHTSAHISSTPRPEAAAAAAAPAAAAQQQRASAAPSPAFANASVLEDGSVPSSRSASTSGEMPDPHEPSDREQILLVETPDLYHRSPDSGDLQYKSRGLQQTICPPSEGWWPASSDMAGDEDFASLARHVAFVLQQKMAQIPPLETSSMLLPKSCEDTWLVDPLSGFAML